MATDPNPWSTTHWDPIAQSNYIRKYGMARAIARARDAGRAVHGPPPAPVYNHAQHKKAVLQIVKRRNALRGSAPPVNLYITDVQMLLGFDKEAIVGDIISINEDFLLGFDQNIFLGDTSYITDVQIQLGLDYVTVPDFISEEIDIILTPGDITFGARFKLGPSVPDIPFGNVMPIFPGPIVFGIDEAASASATISPGTFNLGIADTTAPLDRTRLFGADMSLGLDETATVGNERRIVASLSLGLNVAEGIKLADEHVVADMDLGLSESASISFELDTGAAASLGIDETAVIQLERDFTAAFDLGVTETAIDTGAVRFISASFDLGAFEDYFIGTEALVAASIDLGIVEAATTYRERDLAASMALGVDESAPLLSALLPINFDLGYRDTGAPPLAVMANLASTHSLGYDEDQAFTYTNSITANAMLGLDEVAFVDAVRDTISDMHIGFEMNVIPTLPFELAPVSFSLGISESAAFNNEATLDPVTMALGISEAATVTLPSFRLQFLNSANNTASANPHNYTSSSLGSLPAANEDRYIVLCTGCAPALGGGSVASVTVAGAGASNLLNSGIVASRSAAIWIVGPINTGTSGTISVAKNTGSTNATAVAWYALYAPVGAVIGVPELYQPASAASYSKTMATTPSGVTFGVCINSVNSFSYSSDTPDYARTVTGTNTISGFGTIDASSTHPVALAPTGTANRFLCVTLSHTP